MKKAAHVFYLHFALKKRAFFEEIQEKQEQVCLKMVKALDAIIWTAKPVGIVNFLLFHALWHCLLFISEVLGFDAVSRCNIILKVKEWLQNLGIGDHTAVVHDDDDDDDETAVPLQHDESAKNR